MCGSKGRDQDEEQRRSSSCGETQEGKSNRGPGEAGATLAVDLQAVMGCAPATADPVKGFQLRVIRDGFQLTATMSSNDFLGM